MKNKKVGFLAGALLVVILLAGGYLIFQQLNQPAEPTACPTPVAETAELTSPVRFDLHFAGPCAVNAITLVETLGFEPDQQIIALQLENQGYSPANLAQLRQGEVISFNSVVRVTIHQMIYILQAYPDSSETASGYMSVFFVPADVDYGFDSLADHGIQIICDYYPDLGREYCE
jgi:hypothetical protein